MLGSMTSWRALVATESDFADHVRRTFAVRKHATVATLRRDGSPRISGTEVDFDDATGELMLGAMPASLKALDLRRDARLALHCPTVDTPQNDPGSWLGDDKVSGVAIEVSDPNRVDEPHRFRVDIHEVVLTAVAKSADRLLITSWHPGRGLERQERR